MCMPEVNIVNKPYKILIINGPNLGTTGYREPSIYGTNTLDDINTSLEDAAFTLNVRLEFFRSNHEGDIVDKLNSVLIEAHSVHTDDQDYEADDHKDVPDGIIINAGAYTHYSYAIRDAISACGLPCVEVHMSNVDSREDFRHTSVIGPVCIGKVQGFGGFSYHLALAGLIEYIKSMRSDI